MFMKMTPVVLLALWPAIAGAGMTRATLQVSAQVINNCLVNVPSSVILPAYDGTQVRSRAELQLKCTRNASPVIGISTAGATNGARLALLGPDGSQLSYAIFSDPGYADTWSSVGGQTADGLTFKSYTLYLEIPSGQTVAPGAYSGHIDIAVDPGTRIARHYIVPVSSGAP
jgi:spore coat protein U-like protein